MVANSTPSKLTHLLQKFFQRRNKGPDWLQTPLWGSLDCVDSLVKLRSALYELANLHALLVCYFFLISLSHTYTYTHSTVYSLPTPCSSCSTPFSSTNTYQIWWVLHTTEYNHSNTPNFFSKKVIQYSKATKIFFEEKPYKHLHGEGYTM